MKDPLKSIEWLAFPRDVKVLVVSAYEERDRAVSHGRDKEFWEAEFKTQVADRLIHKSLGANLDYLPEKTTLKDFISELKSSMKTGYNVFEVQGTDPLVDKINSHMDRFKTIRAAAIKQAELNVEQVKERT